MKRIFGDISTLMVLLPSKNRHIRTLETFIVSKTINPLKKKMLRPLRLPRLHRHHPREADDVVEPREPLNPPLSLAS